MKKYKLVAALACRNNSMRLYAKPLQLLDIKKKISILDHIINLLKKIGIFDHITLGISNSSGNKIYEKVAKKHKINFIYGSDKNVLERLIKCAKINNATDIFRITTESPFIYYELIKKLWKDYKNKNLDALFLDNIIDGCGFEFISLKALKVSDKIGKKRHKEFSSLYLRENIKKFKIVKYKTSKKLFRKDLRLTVDYPEDLILCRKIYEQFKKKRPFIPLDEIIKFLDGKPNLKELVRKYTLKGYKTMYL